MINPESDQDLDLSDSYHDSSNQDILAIVNPVLIKQTKNGHQYLISMPFSTPVSDFHKTNVIRVIG
jgi:hypothetical protein